jgi:tripartite-type tricarboxylate transporter receptor subunit TctC
LQAKLGATVIVENQPGGGGFNALQNLMREPGDGLTMLLLNGEAAVLSAIIGQGGLKLDLKKLAYLGRVSYENRTLVALQGTPFAHIDGYLKPAKPVFFGAGSRFDGLGEPASILCDALGIRCKS